MTLHTARRVTVLVATALAIALAMAFSAPAALAGDDLAIEPSGQPAAVSAEVAACPANHFCFWSGEGYTGQRATMSADSSWGACVSAAQLGLSSIKSAQRGFTACQFQAALMADSGCGQATNPRYVQNDTPTIDPPAHSVQQFLIPC